MNESLSRVLGEVEEIRINITATKLAINEWKGSTEGLLKLKAELLVLTNKLKLPIEEAVDETNKFNAELRETLRLFANIAGKEITGGRTGRLGGAAGAIGRAVGLAAPSNIFGAGAQSAQMIKDAGKVGETIFDGWANVLTSNMNTAWAEIFGEANSLFEQLVNSMADLLVKNVFSQLISFIPGGGILGFIGDLFGGGGASGARGPITQIPTSSSRTPGNQTIIIELGGMRLGELVLQGNRQIQERRLTL